MVLKLNGFYHALTNDNRPELNEYVERKKCHANCFPHAFEVGFDLLRNVCGQIICVM